MKKFLCLPLAAFMLSALSACGGNSYSGTNLSGTAAEIMRELTAAVSVAGPPTLESEITAGNCSDIGIEPDKFGKYITGAVLSTAAISTFAHETALIEAKDPASAVEIKKLLAANYDSNKWICVFPEKSCVIESGKYVLLAVGRAENTDAVIEAFMQLAGTAGEPDVFFSGPGSGGPGGMILPAPG